MAGEVMPVKLNRAADTNSLWGLYFHAVFSHQYCTYFTPINRKPLNEIRSQATTRMINRVGCKKFFTVQPNPFEKYS